MALLLGQVIAASYDDAEDEPGEDHDHDLDLDVHDPDHACEP